MERGGIARPAHTLWAARLIIVPLALGLSYNVSHILLAYITLMRSEPNSAGQVPLLGYTAAFPSHRGGFYVQGTPDKDQDALGFLSLAYCLTSLWCRMSSQIQATAMKLLIA